MSTHNVPKLCSEYFVRLTLTNFDWVFDKLLLVIWSVPHLRIYCKFSFATHSLRIFWIQRILLYGGNTMIKWNSNLPPMGNSNPHCFCYCQRPVDNTIIAYIVVGAIFSPTHHLRFDLAARTFGVENLPFSDPPHSLINRVKSPL